jgi:hypothetical protein
MRIDRRLDFRRIDIRAAGDDQVVATVGKIQIAVLIQIAEIAR